MSAEDVAMHLARYGLQTKFPGRIANGAKVLGLHVHPNPRDGVVWSRGNELVQVAETAERVSRRELFSICGLLVGHYPVAGWLRVATGFVKRHSVGSRWEDDIGCQSKQMLQEMLQDVRDKDPVAGKWSASSKPATAARIWCDASSLALGCMLEIAGDVVEDGAWLRKKDDGAHINLAEMDAVVKGFNLAAKWQVRQLEVLTDSATVFSWLTSALHDSHKVKTRGISEMLVKRRLAVLKELRQEYNMEVTVRWVQSEKNKADCLTRVPRRWLQLVKAEKTCAVAAVHDIHAKHHLGVNRTLYLARLADQNVTRARVKKLVDSCVRCQSIDPALVTWETGGLEAEVNWRRLAADVTHFNGNCYLSVVDCGPSRFAIWRHIRSEDAACLVRELEQLFREHGPPSELLVDNGAAFRSQCVRELLKKWQVEPIFRCAYRPDGNGMVERHHRTIKRMAARSNADPLQMCFGTIPLPGMVSMKNRCQASQC